MFKYIIFLAGLCFSTLLYAQDTTELKTDIRAKEKTAAPPMQVVKRQVVPDTYKSIPKAPESNVFGSSFFSTESLSFEPNLRIATPRNYILGPDDELLLNVSGYQEATIKVQVQPEGIINIPQVGEISVTGLTFEEATKVIKRRMEQTAYPNIKTGLTKLNITLGKIRSIHITVIGAAKPGNYTVSSLTTVFNSLYQSGGPGSINSYRKIQLVRNGRVYKTIDLYQFLTKGDESGNVQLKENDVINFPVYTKRVTISGEVKRPDVFEMLDGETLNDLLFLAGGFTDKAYKASVKINQKTDTERRIKDLDRSEFGSYPLYNGDEIQVNAILDIVENSVSISGAVYRPGQFELTKGLTLKGLIEKADGLQEGVFMDKAILTRIHEDKTVENIPFRVQDVMNGSMDIALKKRDDVQIAYIADFNSNYSIQIEGEVRKPGSYPYRKNLSLKDVLFMAGSFTDAALPYHIEVSRRLVRDNVVVVDTIAEVIELNTGRDLADKGDRFILHPFDLISVRRNPGYLEQKRVTISGEIVYPGAYTIRSKKERISDLLTRAGGLTPQAYMEGVYLTRATSENEISESRKLELARLATRDSSSKALKDITTTNARIAIDIRKILQNPNCEENYVLQEGDVINVQKMDPLVKMSGEVLFSTKTNYESGRSLKYYLGKAGGTTDKARRRKIYVLYPNGKVNKTHSALFGLIRSYPKITPGAEIVVPTRPDAKGFNTAAFVAAGTSLISLISLLVVTLSIVKK